MVSDDSTDNGETVEQVAREYVRRHGPDSVPILRERADLSDEVGDLLSAEAWRDIADAAERILRDNPDPTETANPSDPR
jgi:hypothetical protein